MNDIIQTMSISHKKGFVQLLDERMPKIKEVWSSVDEDVSRSRASGPYYCLSSYAFTGTINYKKAFPKSILGKSAIVQHGYIKTKLRNYVNRKITDLTVLLYFDLRPNDLSLHYHGVLFGVNYQINKFNCFFKRNIGFTLIKPIDNPDKWETYCSAKLCHQVLPVVWDGG